MEPKIPTQRTLALMLSVLMGCMLLLSASSTTPHLGIPQISSLDDGTSLAVSGLLVDFRSYDAGVENLVLMDPRSGMTVKVICSKGIGAPPSQYVRIGDELLVKGEVSSYKSSSTILTDSEGISVLKKAEFVLTVKLLSSNWVLFEGDEFIIRGILMQGGHRLYDHDLEHSVMVISEGVSLSQFDDKEVLVDCKLRYNDSIMALTLVVESVHLDG